MNNNTYTTKMWLMILIFVSLILATVISTSIADYVIPVDVYASTAEIDNIKNQDLSAKLLITSWLGIIALGVIIRHFRKKIQ